MKDVIYHNTTTKFKFWDRLRILVGQPVHVNSEIEREDKEVTGRATAKSYVPKLFQKKIPGLKEATK